MCVLSWIFSLFLCTFLQQLLCLFSLQCALGLQLPKTLNLIKHVVGTPSWAASWRQEHLRMKNSWSALIKKFVPPPLCNSGNQDSLTHSLTHSHTQFPWVFKEPIRLGRSAVEILATVGWFCLLCCGEHRDTAVSCSVHLIPMFMRVAVFKRSSLLYFKECLSATKWQPFNICCDVGEGLTDHWKSWGHPHHALEVCNKPLLGTRISTNFAKTIFLWGFGKVCSFVFWQK